MVGRRETLPSARSRMQGENVDGDGVVPVVVTGAVAPEAVDSTIDGDSGMVDPPGATFHLHRPTHITVTASKRRSENTRLMYTKQDIFFSNQWCYPDS